MAHRTTARDINATQRSMKALELRKQGYQLQEIAIACGYSNKSGAWQAIRRELARLPREDAADVRNLELLRLDAMLKALYTKAISGNVWSVDRVLAIMKRRAELLCLDIQKDDAAMHNVTVVREVPMNWLSGPPAIESANDA